MRDIFDERGRPVTVVVRPGKEPTHDDPVGGRRWHYLTLDGERLDERAYLYHYPAGSPGRRNGLTGWRAEVCGWGPGNAIEGYQTRPRVQKWAEAKLAEFGIEVVSADEARRRAGRRG